MGSRWVSERWSFDIADRQLACAPIHSVEGRDYIDAMNSAGNFAFANRSALTQRVEESFRGVASIDADIRVTYDVSHNIAKFETHEVRIKLQMLCAQEGATRAFSGGIRTSLMISKDW